MAMFNGHKNWDHWNVSLWLNNCDDESLYRRMCHLRRIYPLHHAAEVLQMELGGKEAKTPDGARYSLSAIKAAMKGI